MENISYPVRLSDVKKIEKLNEQLKLSINVFGYDNNKIVPFHISNSYNGKHIDLLLIDHHYTAITKINQVLKETNQLNNAGNLCRKCLNSFRFNGKALENHQVLCFRNGTCEIIMPNYDARLDRQL